MKKIYLLILPLFLYGCATSYQPKGITGGYTDTPLREDLWRVTFVGNGYTSAERATKYALLRASEITKREEYDYFVVINSSDSSNDGMYYTPQQTRGQINSDGSYHQQTTGGHGIPIDRPGVTITIKLEKGSIPKNNPSALNPDFIIKKHGPL